MSVGKLFHNRTPAVAKARSPTVAHCAMHTMHKELLYLLLNTKKQQS